MSDILDAKCRIDVINDSILPKIGTDSIARYWQKYVCYNYIENCKNKEIEPYDTNKINMYCNSMNHSRGHITVNISDVNDSHYITKNKNGNIIVKHNKPIINMTLSFEHSLHPVTLKYTNNRKIILLIGGCIGVYDKYESVESLLLSESACVPKFYITNDIFKNAIKRTDELNHF